MPKLNHEVGAFATPADGDAAREAGSGTQAAQQDAESPGGLLRPPLTDEQQARRHEIIDAFKELTPREIRAMQLRQLAKFMTGQSRKRPKR